MSVKASCSNCGVIEHFDLLDAECGGENGEPTGRLLCIRCSGAGDHWMPACDEETILDISIAPSLRPDYEAWLTRNMIAFPGSIA